MKFFQFLFLLMFSAALFSCTKAEISGITPDQIDERVVETRGSGGCSALFTAYPSNTSVFVELNSCTSNLIRYSVEDTQGNSVASGSISGVTCFEITGLSSSTNYTLTIQALGCNSCTEAFTTTSNPIAAPC